MHETGDLEKRERASRTHQRTLDVLVAHIGALGLDPKESRIDLYANNGSSTFIFEVKSIHADNLRSQTRSAIGQLFEYEHFDLGEQDVGTQRVHKAVVYSEEPGPEIVTFLRSIGLEVYWVSDERLAGEPNSMRLLQSFASR